MIWRSFLSKHYGLFNKALLIDCRKLCSNSSSAVNHYEVLGVKKNATQAEIKNAYFELSKIYHPDKITATDETLAKFRAVSDAYQVLGNEQSRKLYDKGFFKENIVDDLSQAEDLCDPIVRFYKERQTRIREMSKPPSPTAYSKKFNETNADKNEFYRYTYKEVEIPDFFPTAVFHFVAATLLAVIIVVHFEDHPINKKAKELLSLFYK